MLLTIDVDGADLGNFLDPPAHHRGIGNRLVDLGQVHSIADFTGSLGGAVRIDDVVAVGRREGVICKPGVGRREHKFRVHPPGPGKVHEEELVEHSRPPFRLALPGNGAQVMQSALASHPAPSVDAAPHLIDVDCRLCSPWFATPRPPLWAAACFHADQTIS